MGITERERLERLFVKDTGVFPPGMDKASVAIDGNEGYDARELAFRLWRELRSLRESCEADAAAAAIEDHKEMVDSVLSRGGFLDEMMDERDRRIHLR